MQTTLRTIPAIDKAINGIQRELLKRQHISSPHRADHWQTAWDREPALRAQETALFRERGETQLELARRAFEAEKAKPLRIPSKKKCPTCGRR